MLDCSYARTDTTCMTNSPIKRRISLVPVRQDGVGILFALDEPTTRPRALDPRKFAQPEGKTSSKRAPRRWAL